MFTSLNLFEIFNIEIFLFDFSEDSFNVTSSFFKDFFLTSHSIGGPVIFGGAGPVMNRGGPVPPGEPVTHGGPSRMWKISGPSLLPADFLKMLFMIFL